MTEDEDLARRLRERLREVARLVDRAAPAPPTPDLTKSRLPVRPGPRFRRAGAPRGRSVLGSALAVALMVILAAAVLVTWNLRLNAPAVAIPSTSRAVESPTAPLPTNSLVASDLGSTPYPTFGAGWPLAGPCATAQDQGVCLFAPDGSLYVATPGTDSRIYAYDPSGHLRAGWPIGAPRGSNYEADNGYALALDGSLLVATPTSIVNIEQSGLVRAGWPVALSAGFTQIIVEPSGTIVVVQVNTATSEAWVVALTLSNDKPELWSTLITGEVSAGAALVASDGTIFVSGSNSKDGSYAVTAVATDGRVIDHWSGQGNPTTVTPAGNLVVVGYDTRLNVSGTAYDVLRTHISVLDRTGQMAPGWPRVIDGPASSPAVGPDGSLYFVLGDTVATGSVLGLDRSGAVAAGWPVTLPPGYAGIPGDQSSGHVNASQPPIVANGLVYVAASTGTGAQMISAFNTSGSDHVGWVYNLPSDGRFAGTAYVPAVISPTGTLYVLEEISSSGAVVALGVDGRVLPGWPYALSPVPIGLTALGDGGVGIYSLDFATRLTTTGEPPK